MARLRSAISIGLAVVFAAGSAAATPSPTPSDSTLARLTSLRLERARVLGVSGPLVLFSPRFGADGVGYGKLDQFPPPRSAVIVDSDEHRGDPPLNPLPWSAIERVERPVRSPGAGAAVLGIVGFLVGGTVAGFVVAESELSNPAKTGIGIGGALVGGVLGWMIGGDVFGPGETWERVWSTQP